MNRLAVSLAALASLSTVMACSETTVTVLTQAPPGRVAVVDVVEETLTVSRGLAVALECTTWNEDYSGPCLDMAITVDDDGIAEVLPVHLDALAGNTVSSGGATRGTAVGGPASRQGGVLAALSAGTTTLTVTSSGAPVSLSLIVVDPTPLAAE